MKTGINKKLGARIRELRIANNHTQSDLADLLNMDRSNLTRIETGNHLIMRI